MRHALAPRLAFFYASYFAVVGVQLPFWPLWLEEARGLEPAAIGILLAAAYWPRVATNLLIGGAADRTGERRRPMVLLGIVSLAGFGLFALADGFWPLLGLSLLTGASLAALLPVGEALTLAEARTAGLDYARLRLWGSIAFIVAAVAAGRLLERTDAALVLTLIVATTALTLLACVLLPAPRIEPAGRALRLGALWRRQGFLAFLLAAGLIQASHSVYYGFATLHWRSAGIGEATIGWLWAEGVIAEIALFLWAGGWLERIGARRVLIVAGTLTVLRWVLTALSPEIAVLVVAQALHAASFGAVHLGAMYYLRDATPAELHASAQGAYAATSALLFGLLTLLSGWMYGVLGAGAFAAMAIAALIGTGLAASRSIAPPKQPRSRE